MSTLATCCACRATTAALPLPPIVPPPRYCLLRLRNRAAAVGAAVVLPPIAPLQPLRGLSCCSTPLPIVSSSLLCVVSPPPPCCSWWYPGLLSPSHACCVTGSRERVWEHPLDRGKLRNRSYVFL